MRHARAPTASANINALPGDGLRAAHHHGERRTDPRVGAQHRVGVEHRERSASKSPPRTAGEGKALTTSRWRAMDRHRDAGPLPAPRRRARLASCLAAAGSTPTMEAISSRTVRQTCRAGQKLSARWGARVSMTTSSASPTESASSASCSGLLMSSRLTIGSGRRTPSGSSRRDWREAQHVKAYPGNYCRKPSPQILDAAGTRSG